jgi:hypothetical protein
MRPTLQNIAASYHWNGQSRRHETHQRHGHGGQSPPDQQPGNGSEGESEGRVGDRAAEFGEIARNPPAAKSVYAEKSQSGPFPRTLICRPAVDGAFPPSA